MDNQKILSEELLKADGINPAGPTDSERTAFKKMLDQQLNSKQAKPNLQIIMHSRITKFAAAAIILLAAYIGINKIGVPIDMAGVALADVAEKMEEVKNAVFEKTMTIFSEDQATNTRHSLVYYDKDGIKEETFIEETISEEIYVNYAQKRIVGIHHHYRTFGELKLTDDDLEKLAPISPRHIIDRLLSKGKFKQLGKKTVNGIPVVGFEFNDKRALFSMDHNKVEDVVTRIWVDIETKLPIRLEFTGIFNGLQINNTMENPTWDVELEDNFFVPNIPDGYLNLQERGLVGIDLTDWPKLKAVPGKAAEKAGVKDGDIAIQVDGKDISHITSQTDAFDLFFGKAGETVVLTVKRGEQMVTVEIEREPLQ